MLGKDKFVVALLGAIRGVQDEIAAEQKAYLSPRNKDYREGFHSGREMGLMIAGAQEFSARLARKLQ